VSPLASGRANLGLDADWSGAASPSGGLGDSAACVRRGLRVQKTPRSKQSPSYGWTSLRRIISLSLPV
jgi:hypothetical protein